MFSTFQADYERRNPEKNAETRHDPTRPRVDLDRMVHMQPSPTHNVIAKLVNNNYIKTVLSQNVDNLHRKSGVPRGKLIELHGNLQCERCSVCGREYERGYRIGPNGGNKYRRQDLVEAP